MPAEIAGHPIVAGSPVLVVAEIGLNHGGSVERALQLVDAAAAAGAHAVKLQVFDASRLVAPDAPGPAHLADVSLQALFRTFELDLDACAAVAARARVHGLAVIATAFDEGIVAGLDALGIDAFKIASGDLTHVALVEAAARTRRPLLLSTGMSTEAEVARALTAAVDAGARTLALLHCVSAYPTPLAEENVAAVRTLSERFDVPVGLSDHGSGLESALLACALGATVYERHLCLPGTGAIDEPVSSTPQELAAIVQALRRARVALGHGRREPSPAEQGNVTPSRRGLYAARRLAPGSIVTAADVIALRPATALGAEHQPLLIGRRLQREIPAGGAFTHGDLRDELNDNADRGAA